MTPTFQLCSAAWRLSRGAGIVLALLALVAAPGRGRLAAAESAPSDLQVKATWLLNFARYVEWPENAFTNAAQPIVLGVAGRDIFEGELDRALAGVRVKGRPMVIRRWAPGELPGKCHIVFVAPSEKRRYREMLKQLEKQPTITVGESEEFLVQGGMFAFAWRDQTIRFAVNLDAAHAAGLQISANLLKVAVAVQRRKATQQR